VLVLACGSSDDGGGGGHSDAGLEDVQTDDTSPGNCTNVTSVSGSVINESDAAMAGVGVVLCIHPEGANAKCLDRVKTDPAGAFAISMPSDSACLRSASYALKADSRDITPLYCAVDVQAGGAITTAAPDRLVAVPVCTRDALGSEDDVHRVTAPDGVWMDVIPSGIFLFDFPYEDLRLRRWNTQDHGLPCFVDASNAPEDLVVFAPEIEVAFDATDAVHVSFPNDAGLEAGTVVDLFGLGGAATLRWDGSTVPEGHWDVIGEAQVTPDGSRIETRPGEGLPFATWVGWKRKVR
jgi:hypothetical protein